MEIFTFCVHSVNGILFSKFRLSTSCISHFFLKSEVNGLCWNPALQRRLTYGFSCTSFPCRQVCRKGINVPAVGEGQLKLLCVSQFCFGGVGFGSMPYMSRSASIRRLFYKLCNRTR